MCVDNLSVNPMVNNIKQDKTIYKRQLHIQSSTKGGIGLLDWKHICDKLKNIYADYKKHLGTGSALAIRYLTGY
jgi:hypothetical protein